MSATHAQSVALLDKRQGPLVALADGEGQANPARALEARVRGFLHHELSGLVGLVTRGAKQWQKRLRGEGPITLGDFCEIVESPAAEAKLAAFGALSMMLARVRPAMRGSLAEAVAAYARETSEVAPVFISAASDGTLTREELQRLRREVLEGRLRSEALLHEIDEQERRL